MYFIMLDEISLLLRVEGKWGGGVGWGGGGLKFIDYMI